MAAVTVGYRVTLNEEGWRNSQSFPDRQLELLAHEFTHVEQFALYNKKLAWLPGLPFSHVNLLAAARFAARYFPEFARSDNYTMPLGLDPLRPRAIPIEELDSLDSHFILDQIANRVEADMRYKLIGHY